MHGIYIGKRVLVENIIGSRDGFKDTQTSICNGHAIMVHPHAMDD